MIISYRDICNEIMDGFGKKYSAKSIEKLVEWMYNDESSYYYVDDNGNIVEKLNEV